MAGKGPAVCPKDLAAALDQAFSKNALIDLLVTATGTRLRDLGNDPTEENLALVIQALADVVSPARKDKLVSIITLVGNCRRSREAYEAKALERDAEHKAFIEAKDFLKSEGASYGSRQAPGGFITGWWYGTKYLGESTREAAELLEETL